MGVRGRFISCRHTYCACSCSWKLLLLLLAAVNVDALLKLVQWLSPIKLGYKALWQGYPPLNPKVYSVMGLLALLHSGITL